MGREQSWARDDDDDDSDHDDKEDHDNNQNYFARKTICITQIEIVSTIEQKATSTKITPTKFYQQLQQQLLSFLSPVPLSHFFYLFQCFHASLERFFAVGGAGGDGYQPPPSMQPLVSVQLVAS